MSAAVGACSSRRTEQSEGEEDERMRGWDEKGYRIAGFPRGTLTHFVISENLSRSERDDIIAQGGVCVCVFEGGSTGGGGGVQEVTPA